MRVLVTGATGFLGRRICSRLRERGDDVRALVRADSDVSGIETTTEVVRGDLRDTWSLHGIAQGVDIIIHAGAVHRGGRLTRDDFWQTNSEGTRRILQEAVRSNVRRFVYVSTAGVHGDVGREPADELRGFAPADLYQTTKLRGEQAVRRVAHTDRLEFSIVRPSTVYGPGDQRFLKLFKPIARRQFVLIGSGATWTHFIARDDCADATIAAAHHPAAAGETFLLGGPRPASMRTLVDSVARAVGVRPPTLQVPYAPVSGLAHLTQAVCALIRVEPPLYPRRLAFFGTNRAYRTDKASRILGFEPTIELDEGLDRTVAWYRSEGHL